jgi:hypothetical protein
MRYFSKLKLLHNEMKLFPKAKKNIFFMIFQGKAIKLVTSRMWSISHEKRDPFQKKELDKSLNEAIKLSTIGPTLFTCSKHHSRK